MTTRESLPFDRCSHSGRQVLILVEPPGECFTDLAVIVAFNVTYLSASLPPVAHGVC